MDGGSMSPVASSSSSSGEGDSTSPRTEAPLQRPEEQGATAEPRMEEVVSLGERLLSGEENVTLITESMSVTSADQEKLLLLNKNTELRRVNKELMKLNEEWDQVYRCTTLGLQQKVESLEQDSSATRQLNNRLLMKVEHEQSARQYYEHTLMQELKKNQHLHEYIRLLEGRLLHTDSARDWTLDRQLSLGIAAGAPVPSPPSGGPGGPSRRSTETEGERVRGGGREEKREMTDSQREVQDLKDQLEALRCQTQIYETEYQTEHKDHKHTVQENRRLRKKREEQRQQLVLLQEQLKVYEDDFRKERSDKQVLQRLLLKKSPAAPATARDPILVHRCNNKQRPPGGDREQRTRQREEPQTHDHHPLCPKHCARQSSEEFPQDS